MNSKKEKWKQSKTKTKIIQRKIIIKLKSKKNKPNKSFSESGKVITN